MKLFYKPGACSLSPHIALREAGVDFSLAKVDLTTKRLENGEDFFAINPKGQVPALQLDDGTLLTEGVAVVQYIADLVPDRQLMAPVGSITRYQTIAWLNYISSELHKGYTPLFRQDTPADFKPLAVAALEKKLAYVNESLEGKQWITGSRFSVADAYLFTVLRWAPHVGIKLDGYQAIVEYMARVEARPAVAAALEAERA